MVETFYDKLVTQLKNRRWIAYLLILASAVAGLAVLLNQLSDIHRQFDAEGPEVIIDRGPLPDSLTHAAIPESSAISRKTIPQPSPSLARQAQSSRAQLPKKRQSGSMVPKSDVSNDSGNHMPNHESQPVTKPQLTPGGESDSPVSIEPSEEITPGDLLETTPDSILIASESHGFCIRVLNRGHGTAYLTQIEFEIFENHFHRLGMGNVEVSDWYNLDVSSLPSIGQYIRSIDIDKVVRSDSVDRFCIVFGARPNPLLAGSGMYGYDLRYRFRLRYIDGQTTRWSPTYFDFILVPTPHEVP